MATYSEAKFKALHEAATEGAVDFSSSATAAFAAECYGDPNGFISLPTDSVSKKAGKGTRRSSYVRLVSQHSASGELLLCDGRKVIHLPDVRSVAIKHHEEWGHLGSRRLFQELKKCYIGITRVHVEEAVKECSICSNQKPNIISLPSRSVDVVVQPKIVSVPSDSIDVAEVPVEKAKECSFCTSHKPNLPSHNTPVRVFENFGSVGVGLTGFIHERNGEGDCNNVVWILMAIDVHSRMGWAWHSSTGPGEEGEAEEMVRILVRHFRYLGRCPKELQMDNNKQFNKKVIRGIADVMGSAFTMVRAVTQHPQTGKRFEAFSKTLKVNMQEVMKEHPCMEMKDVIAQAVFLYNNTPHPSLIYHGKPLCPVQVWQPNVVGSPMRTVVQTTSTNIIDPDEDSVPFDEDAFDEILNDINLQHAGALKEGISSAKKRKKSREKMVQINLVYPDQRGNIPVKENLTVPAQGNQLESEPESEPEIDERALDDDDVVASAMEGARIMPSSLFNSSLSSGNEESPKKATQSKTSYQRSLNQFLQDETRQNRNNRPSNKTHCKCKPGATCAHGKCGCWQKSKVCTKRCFCCRGKARCPNSKTKARAGDVSAAVADHDSSSDMSESAIDNLSPERQSSILQLLEDERHIRRERMNLAASKTFCKCKPGSSCARGKCGCRKKRKSCTNRCFCCRGKARCPNSVTKTQALAASTAVDLDSSSDMSESGPDNRSQEHERQQRQVAAQGFLEEFNRCYMAAALNLLQMVKPFVDIVKCSFAPRVPVLAAFARLLAATGEYFKPSAEKTLEEVEDVRAATASVLSAIEWDSDISQVAGAVNDEVEFVDVLIREILKGIDELGDDKAKCQKEEIEEKISMIVATFTGKSQFQDWDAAHFTSDYVLRLPCPEKALVDSIREMQGSLETERRLCKVGDILLIQLCGRNPQSIPMIPEKWSQSDVIFGDTENNRTFLLCGAILHYPERFATLTWGNKDDLWTLFDRGVQHLKSKNTALDCISQHGYLLLYMHEAFTCDPHLDHPYGKDECSTDQ